MLLIYYYNISMAKDIFVLEVETGKITFTVGYRADTGIYTVKHFGEANFKGIYMNEWVNKDSVIVAVKQAIENSGYNGKIKSIYVGVPSNFIATYSEKIVTNLGEERVIGQRHVDKVFKNAQQYKKFADYNTINTVAIEYILDNKLKVDNPVGYSATTISTDMSYTLCSVYFSDMIEFCLQDYDIKDITYIYSDWANAITYTRELDRKAGVVICNVGYLATSFLYVKNDGVVFKSQIPVGRGNFEGVLIENLGIDGAIASELVSKLDFEVDFGCDYEYYIRIDGEVVKLDAFKINKIVLAEIKDIEDFIYTIINENNINTNTVYLTGDGLNDIRGGIKRLKTSVKKEFTEVKPNVPMYSDSGYCSVFSVLSIASKKERDKHFWNKFFG